MGRPKKELKQVHRKNIKKAKAKVRQYAKGDLSYDKLTSLAKKMLEKHNRHSKKSAQV